MGFMKPVAEHLVMYLVPTNSHDENVPEVACGSIDLNHPLSEEDQAKLLEYCEGSRIEGEVEKIEGWWSRLSANGYLDASNWTGPFDTADEALKEVMDFYEIDENGDNLPDDENDEPAPPKEVPMIGICSVEAIETMRARGGRWYAYQNMDLSSCACGSFQFLQCGTGCTHKVPPSQMPDTSSMGLGWRYKLVGRVNMETGELEEVEQ